MATGQRSFEERLKAVRQIKDPRARGKAAHELIVEAEAVIVRAKELRMAAARELYDRTKSKNHPERRGNWAEVGRQFDGVKVNGKDYPLGISRELARQWGDAETYDGNR